MVRLESCTQPECYLREDGVDCDDLAEIFVRVLSGEDVAIRSPIRRESRCVGCVQGVLQGGKPLPTSEEIERGRHAGKWAHRRARRRNRRGSR